ncbi:MAG TPA: hypothetical protein VLL49_08685 [Anaerolineales bacterium]|nr:hypothetical protein [Anaerolineales bacterium]
MNRIDQRIWFGAGLILVGALMFLERLGVLRGAVDFFWGIVLLAGAAYFLYRFARNPVVDWWAAIPGFALAGLSAENLLPRVFGDLGGLFFLGSLGLGFFAVYLSGRHRWWAIIPGGVLLTLAMLSVLENTLGASDSGGLLFVGLGATFLLVAVAASMRWAYIPGFILLAFGAILGSASSGALDFLWPAALVVCGVLLIWRFARNR